MGGNPWHYFTPYQRNINEALQNLREQEFRMGRYGFDYWFNQMSTNMQIGVTLNQSNRSANELIEQYGSVHAAIEALLDQSMPDGTQSILDMTHVSNQPEGFAVCPLSEHEIQEILQTSQPTRELIESLLLDEEAIDNWQPFEMFWDSIDRGTGRYIVLYQEGEPTEIFFAGYSFD